MTFDNETPRTVRGMGYGAYNVAYNRGWRHSETAANPDMDRNPYWPNEPAYDAWEDGYLDSATGRAKFHLRDCPDHDACGQG